MPNSYNDIKSLPKSVQRLISPNQCCIFRFDTRFGLAIGTEYFGTGPFQRSVSGLPQIFIYIYI